MTYKDNKEEADMKAALEKPPHVSQEGEGVDQGGLEEEPWLHLR